MNKVVIVKTNRSKEVLIPQDLIREEENLVEGINKHCEDNSLNPVYIDNNIAIFEDYLLIAFYEDELVV